MRYIVTIEAKRAVITDNNIGEYPTIIPGIKTLYMNTTTSKSAIIALNPLNFEKAKVVITKSAPKYIMSFLLSLSAT